MRSRNTPHGNIRPLATRFTKAARKEPGTTFAGLNFVDWQSESTSTANANIMLLEIRGATVRLSRVVRR